MGRRAKTYGLYNIKNNEQCEYFGTQKEIAKYLKLTYHYIRLYLMRKRNGKQTLIKKEYDIVEIKEEINE